MQGLFTLVVGISLQAAAAGEALAEGSSHGRAEEGDCSNNPYDSCDCSVSGTTFCVHEIKAPIGSGSSATCNPGMCVPGSCSIATGNDDSSPTFTFSFADATDSDPYPTMTMDQCASKLVSSTNAADMGVLFNRTTPGGTTGTCILLGNHHVTTA